MMINDRFPEMGVPPSGWFLREHPIKIDIWGTPILGNLQMAGNCGYIMRNDEKCQ